MSFSLWVATLLALLLSLNTVSLQDSSAQVLEYKTSNDGKGSYSYYFRTSNGIERSETGRLDENGNNVVEGYYMYVDPDGQTHRFSYSADKDGYREEEGVETEEQLYYDEPPLLKAVPAGVISSLLGK